MLFDILFCDYEVGSGRKERSALGVSLLNPGYGMCAMRVTKNQKNGRMRRYDPSLIE